MLAIRAVSTVFCTFLASVFQAAWAFSNYYCLFFLASEAFFSSLGLYFLFDLNQASSILLTSTPSRGTLVLVLIEKAALTLLIGTPLTEWGPVTKRFPEASLFKTTTLLPLCFPERMITTVPGTTFPDLVGLGWVLFLLKWIFSSSAGYQVLDLFPIFFLRAPPWAKNNDWFYLDD